MLERIFFRKRTQGERRAALVVTILALTILLALTLKLTGFELSPPRVPLLPQADGLREAKTVASAHALSPDMPLPSETFGAEPFVFGLYAVGDADWPEGSTATVLVRDGWRFAEILRKPGRTMAEALTPYDGQKIETLELSPGVQAVLVHLDRAYTRCIDPLVEEGQPGICQISRILFFEDAQALYSLAGDGSHATDGELIAMARTLAAP